MCLVSLLHGTGIGAGGTLVTRGPVGPRLRALAGPAHALAPPAAQQAHAGHAGVGASGAVAVLALPVGGALAEAAVADAVAWERRSDAQPKIALQHLAMNTTAGNSDKHGCGGTFRGKTFKVNSADPHRWPLMTKQVYLSSDATDAATFGKHKASEQLADTRELYSLLPSFLNKSHFSI